MICNDKFPASLWASAFKNDKDRGGVWYFDPSYPGCEKVVRYVRADNDGAAVLADAFNAVIKLLNYPMPGGREEGTKEQIQDDTIGRVLEVLRTMATPPAAESEKATPPSKCTCPESFFGPDVQAAHSEDCPTHGVLAAAVYQCPACAWQGRFASQNITAANRAHSRATHGGCSGRPTLVGP